MAGFSRAASCESRLGTGATLEVEHRVLDRLGRRLQEHWLEELGGLPGGRGQMVDRGRSDGPLIRQGLLDAREHGIEVRRGPAGGAVELEGQAAMSRAQARSSRGSSDRLMSTARWT